MSEWFKYKLVRMVEIGTESLSASVSMCDCNCDCDCDYESLGHLSGSCIYNSTAAHQNLKEHMLAA
jgi:hypothetical protein